MTNSLLTNFIFSEKKIHLVEAHIKVKIIYALILICLEYLQFLEQSVLLVSRKLLGFYICTMVLSKTCKKVNVTTSNKDIWSIDCLWFNTILAVCQSYLFQMSSMISWSTNDTIWFRNINVRFIWSWYWIIGSMARHDLSPFVFVQHQTSIEDHHPWKTFKSY